MNQAVLIVGTGAQAKYAEEIFGLRDIRLVGLIGLPNGSQPKDLDSARVLGTFGEFESLYLKNGRPLLLLCCSDNKRKEELERSLANYSPRYINAIHPAAVIARTAVLGHGIIVNAHAVVQPYAKIGSHVMVHAGTIVEHDCVVENYANLAPGVILAGHVNVGKGATVYSGAIVIPMARIGEYSVIGAGGVVLSNIGNHVTAVGIPAQDVKQRKQKA